MLGASPGAHPRDGVFHGADQHPLSFSILRARSRGEVIDYVREADRAGLATLAFTEHYPLTPAFDPDEYLSVLPQNMPAYIEAVRRARDEYPDMDIILGIEMDYLGIPRIESSPRTTLLLSSSCSVRSTSSIAGRSTTRRSGVVGLSPARPMPSGGAITSCGAVRRAMRPCRST